MSSIGDYIVRGRKQRGISQKDLAEITGLSRSYLCDIERGRTVHPSVETLERIASVLGSGVLGFSPQPRAYCRHWAIQWADGTQRQIECRDCGAVILTLNQSLAA